MALTSNGQLVIGSLTTEGQLIVGSLTTNGDLIIGEETTLADIEFVSKGAFIAQQSGTMNIQPPTSYQAGDLLLCLFQYDYADRTTPSGWTHAPQSPHQYYFYPYLVNLYVWYKIATASESAVQVDVGTNMTACGIMLAFRNVDTNTIFDTSSSSGAMNLTNSFSIPGVTTVTDKCMIVGMFCIRSHDDVTDTNQIGSPSNANLSSLTEQVDERSNRMYDSALYCVTGVMDTAGATSGIGVTGGTITWAERVSYITIALIPATVSNIAILTGIAHQSYAELNWTV